MKLEQLQELYNLIAKYEKKNWIIKKSVDLMGYPITTTYLLDNFLKYGYVDLNTDEITHNKATTKFVSELERITGVMLEDLNLIKEVKDDIYDELDEEFCAYGRNKLSMELRMYICDVFYTNGKLNPWKTVAKNYDPDRKNTSVTIRLSNSYDAVINKDKPVRVGCQRIPIDTIREIVKAYDSL